MAKETPGVAWRKSSYSNGQGDCVETASADGMVYLRDTKLASASPVLAVNPRAFRALLGSVK